MKKFECEVIFWVQNRVSTLQATGPRLKCRNIKTDIRGVQNFDSEYQEIKVLTVSPSSLILKKSKESKLGIDVETSTVKEAGNLFMFSVSNL